MAAAQVQTSRGQQHTCFVLSLYSTVTRLRAVSALVLAGVPSSSILETCGSSSQCLCEPLASERLACCVQAARLVDDSHRQGGHLCMLDHLHAVALQNGVGSLALTGRTGRQNALACARAHALVTMHALDDSSRLPRLTRKEGRSRPNCFSQLLLHIWQGPRI